MPSPIEAINGLGITQVFDSKHADNSPNLRLDIPDKEIEDIQINNFALGWALSKLKYRMQETFISTHPQFVDCYALFDIAPHALKGKKPIDVVRLLNEQKAATVLSYRGLMGKFTSEILTAHPDLLREVSRCYLLLEKAQRLVQPPTSAAPENNSPCFSDHFAPAGSLGMKEPRLLDPYHQQLACHWMIAKEINISCTIISIDDTGVKHSEILDLLSLLKKLVVNPEQLEAFFAMNDAPKPLNYTVGVFLMDVCMRMGLGNVRDILQALSDLKAGLLTTAFGLQTKLILENVRLTSHGVVLDINECINKTFVTSIGEDGWDDASRVPDLFHLHHLLADGFRRRDERKQNPW